MPRTAARKRKAVSALARLPCLRKKVTGPVRFFLGDDVVRDTQLFFFCFFFLSHFYRFACLPELALGFANSTPMTVRECECANPSLLASLASFFLIIASARAVVLNKLLWIFTTSEGWNRHERPGEKRSKGHDCRNTHNRIKTY